MKIADELAAECPHVVDVFLDRLWRQTRCCQVLQERTEQQQQLLAGRQIFLQAHPGTRPAVQIRAVVFQCMARRGGRAGYFGSSRRHYLPLHAATHHHLKSVPPLSGIRLPAGPLQFRSQEH